MALAAAPGLTQRHWAVGRDGTAENLGELIVQGSSGEMNYRTGQKEFALMVTAEPYPLVLKPSDLVAFTSIAPPIKKAVSTPVTVANVVPAARHGNEQIGNMTYQGTDPLELVQAQAVLLHAEQMGAEKYDPDAVRDARITLAQATNSYKANKTKQGLDYARRSLSLSSNAIRDTEKKMAEEAAAAAAARRAAELAALEQQKATAQLLQMLQFPDLNRAMMPGGIDRSICPGRWSIENRPDSSRSATHD
jgi:hypothetical protein